MAQFSIKTDAVRSAAGTEERLRRELGSIQQSIREVSGSLGMRTSAAAGIKRRLSSLAGRVDGHREYMGSMKNALENVADLYEKTEKGICGNAGTQVSNKGLSVVSDVMNFVGKTISLIGGNSITAVWGSILNYLWELIKEIIGEGNVTDTQPTAEWSGDGTAGATAGGNAADSGMVAAGSNVDYKNSVGKQIVHVVDENGNFRPPYSKYSAWGKYRFGGEADKMQCVGYAWGRMEELTGRPVNFSCGYAANIVNTYQGNGALERVNDIGNIRPPALAVINPGGYFGTGPMYDKGHVVVVEAVYPNENGTYDIYFSEGNIAGQKDGTLSVVNSSQIQGCTGYVQFK